MTTVNDGPMSNVVNSYRHSTSSRGPLLPSGPPVRRFNLFAPEPAAAESADVAVGRVLGAEQIAATLRTLDQGRPGHPYHFHHGREEWALVVSGSPTLRTADGERELRPGDVVCFPAGNQGAHELRGPGTLFTIAENRDLDVVEYPEQGEIAVYPPGRVFRTADGKNARDPEQP